jgi:hypothetical protein
VLTLLEFVVRRQLAPSAQGLTGLAAGNPKRATVRPSAEQLLSTFKEITLTILENGLQRQRHLTPLSTVQQRILDLLGFSPTLYTHLTLDSS